NPRLDLGKVPYYPYTTAARNTHNCSTTVVPRQAGIGGAGLRFRGIVILGISPHPSSNWKSSADSAKITRGFLLTDSNSKPQIVVGADHAGFRTKELIKAFLETSGYRVEDAGTHSEESVDYPDYARAVGERVAAGNGALGIVVCGTGIGVSIAANKVEGIRAALAHDSLTARRAREHNDANVLALGGRVVGEEEAIAIVQEFLAAQFAGGRHQRRVDKIAKMDREREHQS
ncbi:MAG: ribose 5-phosphate isomerase B, partial [Candidatus Acidiferrales bacterium]